MGRGAYRPPKPAKVDTSTASRVPGVPSTATKPTRTNTDWRTGIRTASFLSRNSSGGKLVGSVPNPPPRVQEPIQQQDATAEFQTRELDLPVNTAHIPTDLECDEGHDAMSSSLPNEPELSVQPPSSRPSSPQLSGEEGTYEADLDTFEDLTIEETQSSASSLYSRDSSLIYSKDSASIYSSASSIYSSASSIYSSEASIYSFDDCGSNDLDRYPMKGSTGTIAEETEFTINARLPGGSQYQQRTRTVGVRRPEAQDAASRETSSLAKKAALFKNSRLPPQLPSFSTSLPTWSMVCRAAQASQDCYDSQTLTRRGTYTPANSSKDIKAMIIDDQLIDDSRLVIVSVRGTQFKCLSDWAVNKAAKPVKPVGFLDDEENACHAGFLQVAKAMVGQVAAQLQQHPASSERPSLLFTGHSAGGAVAAMLYSHMLSTSVNSDLTALASQFSSVNCVTFGAPPLSLTPLLKRDHASGEFLAFANEGDPVLRLSDAAYVKSLAKLLATLPPSSAVPPPVKVVRRSRGTAIIREIVPAAPPTPWEELPLWPTPLPPLTNAGDVILLRDKPNGSAAASLVTSEDLREVIFGDLAQHTIEMYIRRVKDVAFAAMMGRNVN